MPTNSYAKIGNTVEWEFHVALVDPMLGIGADFYVPYLGSDPYQMGAAGQPGRFGGTQPPVV